MFSSFQHAQGLIFAHRWFEDGSDWAFHPTLSSKMKKLADQLDAELSGRQSLSNSWKTFSLNHQNNTVIGIHKLDDCGLDKRSPDRYQSIMVCAIFRDGAPLDEQNIAEKLSQHVPVKPGPDERLILKTSHNQKNWKAWLMRTAIVAAVLSTVFAVLVKAQDVYEQSKQDVVQAMVQLVHSRTSSSTDEWHTLSRAGKWDLFNSTFCKPQDIEPGGHPDIRWVQSLPDPQSLLADEWSSYVDAMNEWYRHFGRQTLSTRSRGRDAAPLLKDTFGKLDYRSWVERELVNRPFRVAVFIGMDSVPANIRDHALRFCQPDPLRAWELEYAKAMWPLLDRWKVQEASEQDVVDRPWFVIHSFFAFLNRERFEMSNNESAYDLFVSRLPSTNVLVATEFRFDTRLDVNRSLRAVLEALSGGAPGTPDYESAINSVAKALDYKRWHDNEIKRLKTVRTQARDAKDFEKADGLTRMLEAFDNSQSDDEGINAFVQRFMQEES